MNWYAHGDWRPPYYHREHLGDLLASVPLEQIDAPKKEIRSWSDSTLATLSADFDRPDLKESLRVQSPIIIEHARRLNTLRIKAKDASDASIERRFALVKDNDAWSIHQWNDWYDYPRSYWLPENKRGVDLGEPSIAVYAWNCLFGHHGIFSLTPLFLLVFPGAYLALRSGDAVAVRLALAVVIVSLVCIGFYLSRDQLDRNYGGVCSGFRWQFWLIPLWLWLMTFCYGHEQASRQPRLLERRLIEVALIVSVFSAWYPATNPGSTHGCSSYFFS